MKDISKVVKKLQEEYDADQGNKERLEKIASEVMPVDEKRDEDALHAKSRRHPPTVQF